MLFKELVILADEISKKTKEYISISVNHNAFFSGNLETKFTYYNESGTTVEFDTSIQLKKHMQNILNPNFFNDDDVELDEDPDEMVRGAE